MWPSLTRSLHLFAASPHARSLKCFCRRLGLGFPSWPWLAEDLLRHLAKVARRVVLAAVGLLRHRELAAVGTVRRQELAAVGLARCRLLVSAGLPWC